MKTHYRGRRDGYAFCGACVPTSQLTADVRNVTCKLCLRHLAGGLRKPGGEKRRPLGVKPGPKPGTFPSDSLIRRAFVHTEGELAVALVEAEKALAESLKCKDPDEIIAELSGALRRLCDLLGSKTSM